MKNLNFTFKSIVRNKARWLLTLIAILTIGVGQMWADCNISGMSNVRLATWENGGWNYREFTKVDDNHFNYNVYLPANTKYYCQWNIYKDGGNWTNTWYKNDGSNDNPYTARSGEDGTVAQLCFSGYSSAQATSDEFTTANATSGYTHLYVDYYGNYNKYGWNGVGIKFWYSPVTALSLTSLGASSSSVKSGQPVTMSPSGAAGGSGSYSYAYGSSLGGSFDGNTFTAPFYFNSPITTITVTLSDANSQLSGLATVQKTKSITINRPDNMYVKTQFNDWENWGWMTMSSNGDGTYSNTGKYKSSTGCNWSVKNDDGSAPFIAAGSITLVPNDGNWNDGDDCTLKLTPTSWESSKAATASFIRRIAVTASRVTLGSGTGAASEPTITQATYANGKVDYNTSVTFTAPNANTGYTWVGWFTNSSGTGNAYTTNKSFTETVTSAKTYYAIYRENTYTVTVSAGEHGRITAPASPAISVTAGVSTKPTITAVTSGTNSDQYRFWKWTCTGGASVTNATSATTTVSATSGGSVTANFVSVWCLKGGDTSGSNGSDAMGDWQTLNSMDYTGTSYVYRLTIPLAANTTYQFKLYDFPNSSEYRYGDSNYQLAYVGQSSAYNHDLENKANKQNLVIMTAKAGTYTFTWNSNTKRLTVGFPSQTHPNTDNIYFKNSGASTYSSVNAHLWGGSGSTGYYRLPTLPTCTIAGTTYYYAARGNSTTCLFGNGEVNPSTKTADQESLASKTGKYYDLATNTWKSFTFSITYKDQGNVAFSGTQTDPPTTHTFGTATTLKIPTKVGYNFGGWFTVSDCSSGAIGNSSSASLGATDVTNNITLYAKWTPITYTVRYYSNSASYIGTATDTTAVSSHTYDVAKNLTSNGFSLTGYTFAGWGTTTGTSAATYTDGQSVSNLSSTNGATVNLYARWNIQSYTLTWDLAGGTVTTAGTGAAVNATGTPNSSVTYHDAITAPVVSRTGYTFARWDVSPASTMPAVNTTYTAIWTPATLYFRANSTSYWNTAENWEPALVPTIEHNVVIEKPVRVNSKQAQAKNVRIVRYGEDYTGKLTIQEEAVLVVAEDIKAKHASDGDYEATTYEDLQIRTDNSGNGGLIVGGADDETAAEYVFYTKSYKYSNSWYINQYVGIPFASMEAHELYGFNIFVYDATADDWRTPASSTMEPWKSYNLIRKYSGDDWAYFYLNGGILNLPGKTGIKDLECAWRTGESIPASIDKTEGHQDYMFANSWTAPIAIASMTDDDFTNMNNEIYIFNAGYNDPMESQKALGDLAGQWSSFPIASAALMKNAVIPATQAFLVVATNENAKLRLDYNKHVYEPALDSLENSHDISTFPTRAPKHMNTVDMNKLRIIVRSDSTIADQLYIFERADFSTDFDNGWDGHKIMGAKFAPQLYAINGTKKMAVDAIPNIDGTQIGFKAGTDANEYTFSFEYADDAETLYLYDFDTQVYTLISNDDTYTFTTSDTNEHARFAIMRNNAPQIATSNEEMAADNMRRAEKFLENDMLFIRCGGKIYNAEGILVK